jgi:hypothetical protein
MKTTIFTMSLFVLFAFGKRATAQKIQFSAGPLFSVPAITGISSHGAGFGVGATYSFNKKLQAELSVSFIRFGGDVTSTFPKDTIHGFSIMPVLPGIRYFFTKKWYIDGAAGMVIGIQHAGNHLALSPGTGYLFAIAGKSRIDAGVKYSAVPVGYSFAENNRLNKGGYGYFTLQIAWLFR